MRILIVDDHGLVRAGLRARLAGEADIVPVGEAGNAADAVALAQRLQPDLVLLDVVLPRTNGCDAIAPLRRVAAGTKILMMSAQASASTVRRALLAGASGYISKGSSDQALIGAMRRICAGETYVEPSLGARLVVGDQVAALEPLSERECEILYQLALGYTNQEIARSLFISVRTVDTHRAHIMRKLRLGTRAELVMFALSHGLIGQS
ncbi:response regulator transcription factor [Kribbella sp. NBC_00359]|uniref:response regulator transcription factor n=1 Tax=Kribbella sp. NBC_00359 TaxID=2975966 RepID=UPI002E1A36B3